MRSPLALMLAVLVLIVTACSATADVSKADTQSSDGVVASSGPAELTNENIYRKIEQSIVYVQSPDDRATGSGIVIDGGWILTNAHILDRHPEARLGSSDGQDLGLHPVHSVDWILDLAVIGPVDDPLLQPIARGASGDLAIGSRVLLAGFPDEPSRAPTPTVTEGIVSRQRSIALGDFPFLQVDATIAPGQSGGALINSQAELVGISGLEFGEGEFGLALASDAFWPRIEAMIEADPTQLPSGDPVFELTETIGRLDNLGFTLDVSAPGAIELVATSNADIWLELQTLGGDRVILTEVPLDPFRQNAVENGLIINQQAEGGETLTVDVDPGVYQVLIGSFAIESTEVTVTSINGMRRFVDSEEGRALPTGEVIEGEIDWIGDSDFWDLDLLEGQDVSITVDGIADTLLTVRLDDQAIASSDDEAIGVFGTGSQVEFTAAATGTYVIQIGSYDVSRWGYLIEATVSG